jgi:hypothetical protein
MGRIEIRLSKEQIHNLTDILTVTSSQEVRERLVRILGAAAQERADQAANAVQTLFDLFLNAH